MRFFLELSAVLSFSPHSPIFFMNVTNSVVSFACCAEKQGDGQIITGQQTQKSVTLFVSVGEGGALV